MSPVCFSVSFFSFFSSSVPFSRWPSRESSWSLELHIEAEFAETLLSGSLGLCLTMHNWALLLAYSHDCTLFFFFHEMAKNATLPTSTSASLPWRTSITRSQSVPDLLIRGGRPATAHFKRHTHGENNRLLVHPHASKRRKIWALFWSTWGLWGPTPYDPRVLLLKNGGLDAEVVAQENTFERERLCPTGRQCAV